MLNICIPTFNYDVNELVYNLHLQCLTAKISFKIFVCEDGSLNEMIDKNRTILKLNNVFHIINEKNLGRSATRNKLATLSDNGKIIFLDCDSKLVDNNFINNYLNNIHYDIVCGGTTYLPNQKTKEKSLRYKFGIKREMVSDLIRNKNSNISFATNNFMIDKKIFQIVSFREFLKDYGHEDSLFGYELKMNNINIFHINNPVIHLGIETNEDFINKTKLGINNLILIEKSNLIDIHFFDDIKLTNTYNKFNKFKLAKALKLSHILFSKLLYSYLLKSSNPSIFFFDIYKLLFYASKRS